MPVTRKKVIKTVYKHEDSDEETGDFSDSGSEAHISDVPSSEDEAEELPETSEDEFVTKTKKNATKPKPSKKPFAKRLISKINKQSLEMENTSPTIFTVKDLTDEDKLLPPILNLSESDSNDEETPKVAVKKFTPPIADVREQTTDSDEGSQMNYKDVWSQNVDQSEEIAKKAFMELEQHKNKIEEVKESIQNYKDIKEEKISDVKDLLALGEEAAPPTEDTVKKKTKPRRVKDESDSEIEDWEEVTEVKTASQQGIQLIVKFPEAGCKKKKAIDVEMMMKRKINRTRKENQIYMHKVHVLCWLGYGNYVSRVINDQDVMAVALSLVPSKECYPKDRVDMKYIEQITKWFREKLNLKQDKNEDKFKPKAPPLKTLVLEQINRRTVTTKKFFVFVFVALLRALGLQCRIMMNFVTLPLKPSTFELYSLSTKAKDNKNEKSKSEVVEEKQQKHKEDSEKKSNSKKPSKPKIPQVDGNDDDENIFQNIMQVDGNDDILGVKTRSTRSARAGNVNSLKNKEETEDDLPQKRLKKDPEQSTQNPSRGDRKQTNRSLKGVNSKHGNPTNVLIDENNDNIAMKRSTKLLPNRAIKSIISDKSDGKEKDKTPKENASSKPQSCKIVPKLELEITKKTLANAKPAKRKAIKDIPLVSDENKKSVSSKYFKINTATVDENKSRTCRKRSHTFESNKTNKNNSLDVKEKVTKARTKSAINEVEKSKYFCDTEIESKRSKVTRHTRSNNVQVKPEQRVSHRDLKKISDKSKNDVTEDLVTIIKSRIKEAKSDSNKLRSKAKKIKEESDSDSDLLPEEEVRKNIPESDDDFKPPKISPRPSTSKKIDRRVLSSDDEKPKNKIDIWCEIFAEELEQWICVDVVSGKIHDTDTIYTRATHPVCYIVGWDNNNYLKDLTRKYVPHYNTVTRKLRAELDWWEKALSPWVGPKTARDKEEDEYINKMQLEAPLPKSIAEYKNHPLYALKRHLLKFEAMYPSDAATLGFVRGEAVYSRDCVYVCRSRDLWLKEAKVVKLGEKPYKIVKARPKWDKLSNTLIRDKVLELYGPWQVQDYEPPVAENGIVPRNAYGNVELFKECMLPKGTVRIKLPGLNKVARKLNIDCAPAMTGFDYDGGWCHPVYDGFVVCKEFEGVLIEAWVQEQEEQEKREREKTEARVYGNWKKLIRGLLIRERVKDKYGFEKLSASQPTKGKGKAPRFVVKKK